MQKSNVLITCGGKWVGMVLQLKRAMLKVDQLQNGQIIVADKAETTPAGCFADKSVVVPEINNPNYISKLLEVCDEEGIKVLIPLIDLDLEKLAPNICKFEQIGTRVISPPEELVNLCLDKILFEQFLISANIAYPKTYLPENLRDATFPLFYKKKKGFGSIGTGIASSVSEAYKALEKDDSIIFQEYISDPEVSVDAYISNSGKCTVCVQRIRQKVVGGEAYISRTCKNVNIQQMSYQTINALAQRGLRGPLNVQLFMSDKPKLIEVNTRLGSASVLSNVASGERLFYDILNEACGGLSNGNPNDYIENLSLYRFLGDVFHLDSNIIEIFPYK